MNAKAIKISRWVVIGILTFLFGFSAFLKLSLTANAVAQAASMGFDSGTVRLIGAIELFSLILFLIPRTAFLGTLLLIAYMGGAIASHLQHQQPVMMALFVETLVWVSLVLRYPKLTATLFPFRKKEVGKAVESVDVCGA